MALEYFIDVKGYEGLYRCSNQGRVISVKTAREVCTSVNKKGYKAGALYKNKVRKDFSNVGALILMSFYPKPARIAHLSI